MRRQRMRHRGRRHPRRRHGRMCQRRCHSRINNLQWRGVELFGGGGDGTRYRSKGQDSTSRGGTRGESTPRGIPTKLTTSSPQSSNSSPRRRLPFAAIIVAHGFVNLCIALLLIANESGFYIYLHILKHILHQ
jgi:hypothetical protein